MQQRIIKLLVIVFTLSSCGISKGLEDRPDVSKYDTTLPERSKISDSTYTIGNNFLTKNKQDGMF